MKRLIRVLSYVMISVLLLVVFIPTALAASKSSIKSNTTITITTGSGLLYSLGLKKTEVKCYIDTSSLSSEEALYAEAQFTKSLAGAITFKATITDSDGEVTTKHLYYGQSFNLSGSGSKYKVKFTVPGGYSIRISTSAGTIK